MIGKKTSEVPKRVVNRSSSFLLALHVLVLAVNMAALPPTEFGAGRALP